MLYASSQSDESPNINMTPMVDVLLCLLVFFMAATTIYNWDENQFTVKTPEVSDAAPLTDAPDDLVITIKAPGRVEVRETELSLSELKGKLAEAKARYADQSVLVRGDAKLNYQDLADVLAVCESAGIANIRLPVRLRETAPKGSN